MAVTLNASTSAGLVQTADTSGNLSLQSGGTTILALTSAGADVTGTLSATGILSTTNATDATTTASASVTTLGGLGVAKKLYVGDTIRIPNNTYIKARNAANSADQLMMGVNAADVLYVNGSFTASVANTGTLSLGTLQKGLLVIVDNSADVCGIFVVSNLITYEISDPDNKYSATAATASMTNLYNSAGSVILQNNSGGTRSYSITLIQ